MTIMTISIFLPVSGFWHFLVHPWPHTPTAHGGVYPPHLLHLSKLVISKYLIFLSQEMLEGAGTGEHLSAGNYGETLAAMGMLSGWRWEDSRAHKVFWPFDSYMMLYVILNSFWWTLDERSSVSNFTMLILNILSNIRSNFRMAVHVIAR